MRRPLLVGCLCLAAAMALRILTEAGSPPLPQFPPGEEMTVTGRISAKSPDSFTLKDLNIHSCAALSQQESQSSYNFTGRTRLICRMPDADLMLLGSEVTVSGIFAPFEGATNPGQFDYRAYYRSIDTAGTLLKTEVLEQGQEYSRLLELLYGLRLYWRNRLYAVFPEREASVMCTMLLGEKQGLDADLKELYRRNGIIHILSISGLHITLIGMGIYRLLKFLRLKNSLSALMGGAIVLLYGLLTGMSVSACRAIIMYLIRMAGIALGRTYDMLTALGIAAAGLLLYRPYYLTHAGFLLSFSAIVGIGCLYPALAAEGESAPAAQKYIENPYRRALFALLTASGETFKQSLLGGISITLLTLPVQLWFYYEIPTYSVFINLLVLPLMGILMFMGFFVMLLPGTGILGTVPYLILTGYEKLCTFMDTLPGHCIVAGRPAVWKLVVYYVCLAGVIRLSGRGRDERSPGSAHSNTGVLIGVNVSVRDAMPGDAVRRAFRLRPLILALAAWLLLMHPFHRERVTFLDVGQGECIVVQTEGQVYVVDCGSSSEKGVGTQILIPYLKYEGLNRIDALVLTHADEDHTNGAVDVFACAEQEGVRIGAVMIPADVAEEERFAALFAEQNIADALSGVPVISLSEGMKTGPAEEILCLRPGAGKWGSGGNEASLCLYVHIGEMTLLLTGDVEGEGERELMEVLDRYGINRVNCLKIAHHGSKNATSEEFLDSLGADLAVISCGRNNPYGHPHEETLQRLAEHNIPIWKTPRDGAVTLTVLRKKLRVEGFLDPDEE